MPPDEVVAAVRTLLADQPVADLTVEEAGLDEAFLDLYRSGPAEDPGGAGEPPGTEDPADAGDAPGGGRRPEPEGRP
nr:hypothetical protein KitaXyl93_01920 [Kitasatospora sp. Xyl93]